MYDEILYEVNDPVAVITLNRPDSLNAWTDAMGREITDAMQRAAADKSVVGHRGDRCRSRVLRRRRHEPAQRHRRRWRRWWRGGGTGPCPTAGGGARRRCRRRLRRTIPVPDDHRQTDHRRGQRRGRRDGLPVRIVLRPPSRHARRAVPHRVRPARPDRRVGSQLGPAPPRRAGGGARSAVLVADG